MSIEGSEFPKGVTFTYVPYTPEKEAVTTCGIPIKYNADKELAGKKVVIVSVPGAFTPTCMEVHIPAFVAKAKELKAKGVDDILVIAANDPFVMSAWGKALGAKGEIKFATDTYAEFSKKIGFSIDKTDAGLGVRTGRYALIVDNGKIVYAKLEPAGGVTVSGVDAVLAAL